MLNFLPILLITSMLSKNGNGEGFSKESLLPIIKSLGMDENLLNTFFNNSPLSMVKDGNFSLEKLLPLALSMICNFKGDYPRFVGARVYGYSVNFI